MRIIIVGAGNLATHLAKALADAGHKIVGICSRNYEHALALSQKVEQGSVVSTSLSALPTADIAILAVNDDAIEGIIEKWPTHLSQTIVVHTSGSISISVLSKQGIAHGVFYPLQTFSKDCAIAFNNIPCFVEGSTPEVEEKLHQLASTISHEVHVLDSEKRRLLHLAAVFACNFVNHLYDVAMQQLTTHDMPTEWLLPLISETARKVQVMPARAAQTGPAVRGDARVLDMHRHLLDKQPQHLQLYNLLSESIYRTFHA